MAGFSKIGKDIAKGLRRYSTDEGGYVTHQWFNAATRQFAEWRNVVGLLVLGGTALVGVDQWILAKHFDNKIDPVAIKVEGLDGKVGDLTTKVDNLQTDVTAIRRKIGA